MIALEGSRDWAVTWVFLAALKPGCLADVRGEGRGAQASGMLVLSLCARVRPSSRGVRSGFHMVRTDALSSQQ